MESYMSTVKFVLICFLSIISPIIPSPEVNYSGGPLVPALYAFGDSLLDSGNNNLLPTFAKADFYPYGFNFEQGPTGRFTNGRTVVDFIAEYLGLPLLPPYLGVRGIDQTTGINYASGSCGILFDTGKSTGKCLSLMEQINLFRTTVAVEMPKRQSLVSIPTYLSRAIFGISIGSNDYINNYLINYATSALYSPQSFAQLLINQFSQNLQTLYELGARKFVVFEIGPIGCIPSIRRTHKHSGSCVTRVNHMARMFNRELRKMVKRLSSGLEDSAFVLGRIHKPALHAIMNPSLYGFSDSSNPCCTTWENGTSACIPNLLPCSNPDEYMFWDGFHLTQAVYRNVANRCIYDSSICTPMSIKDFVQV